MNVLLRTLHGTRGGVPVYEDTQLSTAQVSVGCGADQQIQLLGAGLATRHAVIRGTARGWTLSVRRGHTVLVNGVARSAAILEVGDRLELGAHRLAVAPPPVGFDLALEVHRSAEIDAAAFEDAFTTDLQQTWLGARWPAWLGVGLVVALAFLLPALVAQRRREHRPLPPWLPTDALWSTGPLSPSHQQVIGGRCDACHQTTFTVVQDGACRACHGAVADHVPLAHGALAAPGSVQRCASCHREHQERALGFQERTPGSIDRRDAGCVGCHAGAPQTTDGATLAPVTGFGVDRHPSFKLLGRMGSQGLKFSHARHLDAGRVTATGGRPLGCADCHHLSTDGEHFEDITMAKQCSGCHELTFDPEAPDRQLPHGKPREVVWSLEDYFARKLSQPRAADEASPARRLPGHDAPREDVLRDCKGSILACSMRSAAAEVETQFLRRGCVTCHQITDTGSRTLVERFKVQPILLVRDFYPAAHFPHRRHLLPGGGDGTSTDAACASCHPAQSAEAAGLQLLPDLPVCARCHADTPAAGRTELRCVSCHDYHPGA